MKKFLVYWDSRKGVISIDIPSNIMKELEQDNSSNCNWFLAKLAEALKMPNLKNYTGINVCSECNIEEYFEKFMKDNNISSDDVYQYQVKHNYTTYK